MRTYLEGNDALGLVERLSGRHWSEHTSLRKLLAPHNVLLGFTLKVSVSAWMISCTVTLETSAEIVQHGRHMRDTDVSAIARMGIQTLFKKTDRLLSQKLNSTKSNMHLSQ